MLEGQPQRNRVAQPVPVSVSIGPVRPRHGDLSTLGRRRLIPAAPWPRCPTEQIALHVAHGLTGADDRLPPIILGSRALVAHNNRNLLLTSASGPSAQTASCALLER